MSAHMADSLLVYKEVIVGGNEQTSIGAGDEVLNGSVDVDGVVHVGDETFDQGEATLMVANSRQQQGDATVIFRDPQSANVLRVEGGTEASTYIVGTDATDVLVVEGGTAETVWIKGTAAVNALVVDGHQTINSGNLHTSNLLTCTGQLCAWSASTINVQGWKGFDIEHPSEKGHRLRHVCLEGPEGAIYTRGRCRNKNEIALPKYWKDLVHTDSITVQLQPIGSHQDIIVKRWDAEKIYLQSQGGTPIDCFYHVYGERKDGDQLIVEYPGKTPEDYPGDNTQYSIAGYHYDRRTL